MNRYLNIIIFFILLFPYGKIISTELEDKLVLLKVTNSNFLLLLDEIIEHEKQCDYYSEKLTFDISFIPNGEKLVVNIGSIVGNMYRIGNEQGIFEYKGHSVIISGILEETIFSVTDKEVVYEYETIKDNYDPDTGEFILWIIEEDDSHSYWNFQYLNGEFILEGFSTYCQ